MSWMNLPTVPPLMAQRRRPIGRWVGRLGLWLGGWRVRGEFPNVSRVVGIGAPHTSAWDFVFGILAILALELDVTWLGADWIFRIPFMRSLGGIPIDRSAPHGVVKQLVSELDRRERFLLALSPEGSRKKVARWKSGFYYLAEGAGVPVMLVAIDRKGKCLEIGPCVELSGDMESDMDRIRPFFQRYEALYPDNFALP